MPSLLVIAQRGFDVLVVDQSSGDETQRLLSKASGVRYVRDEPLGISHARNVAVSLTSAPFIAFTDDDVTLPPTWLERIARAFDGNDEAGAVCGRAKTPRGQWLPGVHAGVYRWPTKPFGLGSGFNLAFRRSALEQVGTFDEELGAGATFRAGEDTDMLYRLLRAGWSVVCSDEITVVHHDWRSTAAERALHYEYGVGAGALVVGHVLAGDMRAAIVGVREAAHHLGWIPRALLRLRFHGASLQLAFLAGLVAGSLARWRALRSQRAMRA